LSVMALPLHTHCLFRCHRGPAVALAPNAMEAVADAAISRDVVTTLVDTTHVVSGANGAATAAAYQGAGLAATRFASPSTLGNGRVSSVDIFEDTQNSTVNIMQFPLTPPPRCLGSSRAAI